MEAILVEDVEKVGKRGEVVKVRPGFFRNFLFPRGKAVPATPSNMKVYEQERKRREEEEREAREKAEALSKKLDKLSLTLTAKVGEDDKLFGSVTSQEIAGALKEQGHDVDKRKIELEEPIKKTGSYTIRVKLHPEVESQLKVKIVKG